MRVEIIIDNVKLSEEEAKVYILDEVIDALIYRDYQDEQYNDNDIANDITWRILKMYHHDKQ